MGKPRLRIGVVTPVFPNSAERYRGNYNYSIVKSLQRHADVQVFTPLSRVPDLNFLRPRSMRYNPVDVSFVPGGVPVKYLPYRSIPIVSRPFNGLVASNCVRPCLENYRPDVVLAYWIYPEGYGALRIARSHGWPLVMGCLGSDMRRVSDPISNYLTKWTVQNASAVITVSEEMRQQAIGYGVEPDRAYSITNGCDLEVFRPGDRRVARQNLGIAADQEVITFVGWLSPTKGLLELLNAVALLKATRPNVVLNCIGEGPLAQEVLNTDQRFGGHGHFRVVGPLTSVEIAEYLAASNVFCLPSYSEGCPNVVLEALACGRPVVATNVGGIPEILNGDCGVLVPPRDVAALCAGLEEVLKRDWNQEVIARERGRDWHAVADETYEVCAAVARQSVTSVRVQPSPEPRPEALPVPRLNLGKDERLRITVVTPIFPTSAEPYRGWPVFKTVEGLQELANLKVISPICRFPRNQWLQPRSMRYKDDVDVSYRPGGMEIHYLRYDSLPLLGRPLNGRQVAAKILPIIGGSRPDMILGYWLYPEGYGSFLVADKLGLPIVIGSRGSDLRLTDPLSRPMARRVLREADHVLTVSGELRRRAIAAGARPERVSTIVNGIDLSVMKLTDQREARQKVGADPEEKLIIFIGWLSRTKGLDTLISAMRGLASRRGRMRLVTIGEGPLHKELLRENAGGPLAGRVLVLGGCDRPTIADWLSASDLLCLPSVAEGCPNVVIESLACGRPVVASNVGGIPEILTPENGILLRDHSVEALEEGLELGLQMQWDEKKIASHWRRSWMDVARETHEICRAVVDRKNGTPQPSAAAAGRV